MCVKRLQQITNIRYYFYYILQLGNYEHLWPSFIVRNKK